MAVVLVLLRGVRSYSRHALFAARTISLPHVACICVTNQATPTDEKAAFELKGSDFFALLCVSCVGGCACCAFFSSSFFARTHVCLNLSLSCVPSLALDVHPL